MTAAWLLPVVPTIVASATGGLIAEVLPNTQHALWTLIISYILWGMGISLALFTLVIYFQRLTLHRLPPREVIVSVFLPLGPLGQGGFAILQMGKVALKVLPETGAISTNAGEILYVLGFVAALVMWGFGLVWLFFALASISRSKFPFNMGTFNPTKNRMCLGNTKLLLLRMVGFHIPSRGVCVFHYCAQQGDAKCIFQGAWICKLNSYHLFIPETKCCSRCFLSLLFFCGCWWAPGPFRRLFKVRSSRRHA